MKSIDRIDEQPTAVDQPLLRLRNVYQDRRSGKDRRMGVTHMDPALDRRKGERRKNSRRVSAYRFRVQRFRVQGWKLNKTGAPVKLVGLVYCGEFNGQAVFFDLMVIKFLLSFE